MSYLRTELVATPDCFLKANVKNVFFSWRGSDVRDVKVEFEDNTSLTITYNRYLESVKQKKFLTMEEYEHLVRNRLSQSEQVKEPENHKWLSDKICLCWTQAGFKQALNRVNEADTEATNWPTRYPALVVFTGFMMPNCTILGMDDLEYILSLDKEHRSLMQKL